MSTQTQKEANQKLSDAPQSFGHTPHPSMLEERGRHAVDLAYDMLRAYVLRMIAGIFPRRFESALSDAYIYVCNSDPRKYIDLLTDLFSGSGKAASQTAELTSLILERGRQIAAQAEAEIRGATIPEDRPKANNAYQHSLFPSQTTTL